EEQPALRTYVVVHGSCRITVARRTHRVSLSNASIRALVCLLWGDSVYRRSVAAQHFKGEISDYFVLRVRLCGRDPRACPEHVIEWETVLAESPEIRRMDLRSIREPQPLCR